MRYCISDGQTGKVAGNPAILLSRMGGMQEICPGSFPPFRSATVVAFTLAYGESVCFDSRLCVYPTMQEVTDYFRWRQSDAERCALNGWAYWTLRKDGLSEQKASDMPGKQPPEFKRTLLLQHSIEWSNLPHWQRYGTGLYWEAYEKEGYNPLTGERIMAQRRKINVDEALPVRSDYTQLLQYLVAESSKKKSA